jgi:hypothetical protein
MPELTPQSTPPPVPPVTPQEARAQHVLTGVWVVLSLMKSVLEIVHAYLPEVHDATAMEEQAVPESLTYALRGDIEVSLSDQIGPALETLGRAVKETPESLRAFWDASQGSR